MTKQPKFDINDFNLSYDGNGVLTILDLLPHKNIETLDGAIYAGNVYSNVYSKHSLRTDDPSTSPIAIFDGLNYDDVAEYVCDNFINKGFVTNIKLVKDNLTVKIVAEKKPNLYRVFEKAYPLKQAVDEYANLINETDIFRRFKSSYKFRSEALSALKNEVGINTPATSFLVLDDYVFDYRNF